MKDSKHSVLPTNLRLFRRLKNLTQEQVAPYLCVHRSTYAYYKQGKTQPSIAQLQQLAVFYGVTVNDLLMPYDDVYKAAYLLRSRESLANRLRDSR